MQRNPIEHHMKQYYANVRYRKFKPWLIYQQCTKCKNEFLHEPMYEVSFHDDYLTGVTNYYNGCTHCFPTIEDFKKYSEENIILKKEDWLDDNGNFIEPMVKRIMKK